MVFFAIKPLIKLIKPSKILNENLLIQICIYLSQIQIFFSNGSFSNLVCFGPSPSTWIIF
jgi:hypothetical protein